MDKINMSNSVYSGIKYWWQSNFTMDNGQRAQHGYLRKETTKMQLDYTRSQNLGGRGKC